MPRGTSIRCNLRTARVTQLKPHVRKYWTASTRRLMGKKLTVIISLDISAAFDTINHSKLVSRFRDEFGVNDTALNWLKSYIEDRHQFVKLGRHSSATECSNSGVPQGSILGPLIFTAYVSPVGVASYLRQYLPLPVAQTLACSIAGSRLD